MLLLDVLSQEDTAWAVGDAGTLLQTDDRGQTWTDITNDVIRCAGRAIAAPSISASFELRSLRG